MRRAKREYYAVVCNGIKNPKKGWTALRSLMGKNHKEPIQAILTEDGEVTGDQQIAEVFNKYFTSLFTSSTSVCDLLHEENEWCETGFKFRKLSIEDIQKELKSLDMNKATGLDGISAKCLRKTASAIAGSLNHLFNLSLARGEIPQEWKAAKVSPIFKAGNEMSVENYRPISVLPVVAKVFEKLVCGQLYSFLLERNLLTGSQSGFRPGHSAQDLVLKVVDDWRGYLDNDEIVGSLFIDLTKAFDSIDHQLMLLKLQNMGVDGIELAWFQNYLCGRMQCVAIGKARSSLKSISS